MCQIEKNVTARTLSLATLGMRYAVSDYKNIKIPGLKMQDTFESLHRQTLEIDNIEKKIELLNLLRDTFARHNVPLKIQRYERAKKAYHIDENKLFNAFEFPEHDERKDILKTLKSRVLEKLKMNPSILKQRYSSEKMDKFSSKQIIQSTSCVIRKTAHDWNTIQCQGYKLIDLQVEDYDRQLVNLKTLLRQLTEVVNKKIIELSERYELLKKLRKVVDPESEAGTDEETVEFLQSLREGLLVFSAFFGESKFKTGSNSEKLYSLLLEHIRPSSRDWLGAITDITSEILTEVVLGIDTLPNVILCVLKNKKEYGHLLVQLIDIEMISVSEQLNKAKALRPISHYSEEENKAELSVLLDKSILAELDASLNQTLREESFPGAEGKGDLSPIASNHSSNTSITSLSLDDGGDEFLKNFELPFGKEREDHDSKSNAPAPVAADLIAQEEKKNEESFLYSVDSVGLDKRLGQGTSTTENNSLNVNTSPRFLPQPSCCSPKFQMALLSAGSVLFGSVLATTGLMMYAQSPLLAPWVLAIAVPPAALIVLTLVGCAALLYGAHLLSRIMTERHLNTTSGYLTGNTGSVFSRGRDCLFSSRVNGSRGEAPPVSTSVERRAEDDRTCWEFLQSMIPQF